MLAFLFLTAIAGPEPDPAPPKAPFAGADIRALIARMTDVKASFQERCGAEDELEKRRPQDVLPRLLPELAKGMPPGGIWNGLGSREANRHGPVRWQIWYAVHRVWDRHVGALPAAEASRLLPAESTSRASAAVPMRLGQVLPSAARNAGITASRWSCTGVKSAAMTAIWKQSGSNCANGRTGADGLESTTA